MPPASRACPAALVALLVTLILALPIGFGPPPASAAVPGANAAASALPLSAKTQAVDGVSLHLDSVTPAVAAPDEPVTITASLRNGTASARPAGTVTVLKGDRRLTRPADLYAWTQDVSPATGAILGSAPIGEVPAGGTAAVTITLPRAGDLSSLPFDVIPVSVEAAGAVAHTFVGVHRAKEYEPLSLAWLLPVTLDPLPELAAAPSAQRWTAWGEVLGEGSRLARLTSAMTGPEITLAVDPALVDPDLNLEAGADGTPVPTPTPAPSPSPSPSADVDLTGVDPLRLEAQIRTEGAQRLRTALAGDRPFVLPAGDPDLAAIGTEPALGEVLTDARERAVAVAADLDGRTDVVWPADPRFSEEAAKRYAARLGAAVGAVIVDRDRLAWRLDQGNAGRKSEDGTPLLARERWLSNAAARAVRPETAAEGRQEFLAQSFAVLLESPGLARTVLVAPDRGFDPDPAAAGALLALARAVPWLSTTTLPTLLDQAAGADAVSGPVSGPEDPIPASPLTEAAQTRIARDLGEAADLAAIRGDGRRVLTDWRHRLDALTATAWRSNPQGFDEVRDGVERELAASATAVTVAAQTINFFADTGRVQVTVLNGLDVPVQDVRVRLVPGNPRLRIEGETKTVSIGAKSRTTVTYQATALAAGPVTIEALVTGPNGTAVGPTTRMLVRVTPTGAAVYWILGAIIVVVFALGLWRNIRSRRRSDADAVGPETPNAIQVDEEEPR
jgi:hypothetical protein